MNFFSPHVFNQRLDQPELMDTHYYPLPVMRETLRFLEITNRYFGGHRVILNHLDRWSVHWPNDKTITLLDVGTGGADIPRAIASWARRRNKKVHITGIDIVPEIVRIAQEQTKHMNSISIEQADFLTWPSNQRRFDYVIGSLFFHHMPPALTLTVLRKFDEVSLRGIILSDLVRSRMGYGAVTLLSRLIGNDIVRHDGPLSVRRAFRLEELTDLARSAGLTYLTARREPWFRLSLAGGK